MPSTRTGLSALQRSPGSPLTLTVWRHNMSPAESANPGRQPEATVASGYVTLWFGHHVSISRDEPATVGSHGAEPAYGSLSQPFAPGRVRAALVVEFPLC